MAVSRRAGRCRGALLGVAGAVVAAGVGAAPAPAVVAPGTIGVSGRVDVVAGQPVGASVVAVAIDRETGVTGYQSFADVDDTGRYSFSGLRPGRYRFAYSSRTWSEQCLGGLKAPLSDAVCERSGSVVTLSAPTTELPPQTLRFARPVFVGTVTGPDGKPLAGARIFGGDEDLAVADSNGRYRAIPFVPEGYTLQGPLGDFSYEAAVPVSFAPFTSNTVTTKNLRLRSRTTLAACARAGRSKVTVKLDIDPRLRGTSVGGTVTITYRRSNGKAGLRTVRANRTGHASAHLPRVKAGTRSITVRYRGSASAAPSKDIVKIRVPR